MYKNFIDFKNSNAFRGDLSQTDKKVFACLHKEERRQEDGIELIASENFVSKAVLRALGSVMTNKYAEGYPNKRYYGGCEYMDEVEELAIERLKALFKVNFVNVQPHSGSQANQAVFLALIKPGDTILSLSLSCGGHLTHGSPVNQSGKWFNPVHFSVDEQDHRISMQEVEHLAKKHKPKIIIAGGSAYPREWEFRSFRTIADSVGAYLLADISHFSGLVATGLHNDPVPYAHVVTSTTHKTLRGPRGGIILTNDATLAKKIDASIFPGLQGGPLMHCIAAKAVAFGEALRPEFKDYIKAVKSNAKTLAETLQQRGVNLISKGTENHLMVVDLRQNGLTGKEVEESLSRAGITCNKNGVPFDPQKPTITSGVRLGTPAATTRGFGKEQFKKIGIYIGDIIDALAHNKEDVVLVEKHVLGNVLDICEEFPLYKDSA